jgi:folate-dependent tRNA-U54 methylase TrmFO/GidA
MEAQALVIRRGIASAEAAWQAAGHGLQVKQAEMRPHPQTGDRELDRLTGQLTRAEGCRGRVATRSPACRNAPWVAQGTPVLELTAETILAAPLRPVTAAEQRSFQLMLSNPGQFSLHCPSVPKAHKERAEQLFPWATLALGAFPGDTDRGQCA